jgi:hypothetical protein
MTLTGLIKEYQLKDTCRFYEIGFPMLLFANGMSNIFCDNQNWFRCKIQYKIPQRVSLLLLSDDISFDSLGNNEK